MSNEFDFEMPDSLKGELDEMQQEQALRTLARITAFFYHELIFFDVPQVEASRMARAFVKEILRGVKADDKGQG